MKKASCAQDTRAAMLGGAGPSRQLLAGPGIPAGAALLRQLDGARLVLVDPPADGVHGAEVATALGVPALARPGEEARGALLVPGDAATIGVHDPQVATPDRHPARARLLEE